MGDCYQPEEVKEESTEEEEEVEADVRDLLVIRRALISTPSVGDEQASMVE